MSKKLGLVFGVLLVLLSAVVVVLNMSSRTDTKKSYDQLMSECERAAEGKEFLVDPCSSKEIQRRYEEQ